MEKGEDIGIVFGKGKTVFFNKENEKFSYIEGEKGDLFLPP